VDLPAAPTAQPSERTCQGPPTTTTVRLLVGRARTTTAGQLFPVTLQDGSFLGEFRQPFYGSARALLARGFDPGTPLELWRDGSLSLSGLTVGQAAALTVEERRDGTPQVRRYKPHPNQADRA
jgi:hypothetical protein